MYSLSRNNENTQTLEYVPMTGELAREQRGRLLDHGLRVQVARAAKAGAHVGEVRAGVWRPLRELALPLGGAASARPTARLPPAPVAVHAPGAELLLLLKGTLT